MLSYSGRGLALSQYLKGTVENVGGRQILPALTSYLTFSEERDENIPVVVPHDRQYMPLHVPIPPQKQQLMHHSLSQSLFRKQLTFSNGIGVGHSYRFAHTDIQIPDFDSYRKKSTKDPSKRNDETIDDRRNYIYLMAATIGVSSVITSKYFIHVPIHFLSPAKDQLAMASIEVKISNIPEGKNLAVKWRGKPVFIRHRTAKEIETERAVDVSQLRDPESDEKRCPTGEWLVVIGVCTHLGCVPIAYQGEYGGYYCPCHGSHYDISGRIRKGPAPLNLEIPDHQFVDDKVIVG